MSENDFKDALIYASIRNIITPQNILNNNATYWKTDSQGKPIEPNAQRNPTTKIDAYINFTKTIGIADDTSDNIIQNLLSDTTIKRACCLKNSDPEDPLSYNVTVKLPYLDSAVPGTNLQKLTLYKKFGFINKKIKVPVSMCPPVYVGPASNDGNSHACDNFYRLYCENAKQMYANDASKIGNTYNPAYLSTYAPDCACFMDTPISATKVQPACYAIGCLTGGKNVYRDRETRKEGACTINQCNSYIDMGGLRAEDGGQIGLSTTVNQTCGEFSNSSSKRGSGSATSENKLLDSIFNEDSSSDSSTSTTKAQTSGSGSGTSTSKAQTSGTSTTKVQKLDEQSSGLSKNAQIGIIVGTVVFVIIIISIVVVVVVRKRKINNA